MKKLIILVLVALHIQSFGQPTEEQIRQVEEAKKEVKRMKGQQFPSFEFTTIDGKTYTSEELDGKILMVNFWFSRCGPCIQEMPEMNEMVEKYQSEDVVFLAPTFDDAERISKFLSKRAFDYQIVPDVKDFCLELNVRSYPTHFVVNREGTIEKVIIGYSALTVGALRKSLRKLLNSE